MWPNWQDSFSVKSFVWISKTHENESGQMRLKKVKWAWYDAYLSQTMWNPTKKMTEIAQTARFIVFTMCGSWKSWSNGIAFLTTWLFQGFTKCGTLPSLVILNRSYGCSKSGQILRFFWAEWRQTNPLFPTLIQYGTSILKIVAVSFFKRQPIFDDKLKIPDSVDFNQP